MSPKYVGFGEAVQLFFKNYTNFKARSTRSEYWWWCLAAIIAGVVLNIIGAIVGSTVGNVLSGIWGLATLIPGIAIVIRRLHDIGKSGWWILIGLIPLAGAIILIVFAVKESGPANEWGEPAKAN